MLSNYAASGRKPLDNILVPSACNDSKPPPYTPYTPFPFSLAPGNQLKLGLHTFYGGSFPSNKTHPSTTETQATRPTLPNLSGRRGIYILLTEPLNTQPKGRVHLNQHWASVQSTAGSRGVRISGTNDGYIMFRCSVKCTGYTLHSTVSHHFS